MHKWLRIPIPAKRYIVDTEEKKTNTTMKQGATDDCSKVEKKMKWLTSDETVPIVRKLYCVLSIIPVGRGGGGLYMDL